MSLRDDVVNEERQSRQNKSMCGVAKVLAEHDDKELEEVVEDTTLQAKATSRALKSRGINLSDWTLRHHRRKECSCY